MRVKRVKPFEIPQRLLEQKKTWNLELFYEYAVRAEDSWSAFVMDQGDDGDPVVAVIITDDPLYDAVECQTIIVDKARRTPELVAEASIIARELTLAEGRKRGRKYAGCGTKEPEKFLQIWGNPPTAVILESVIREEV